MRQAAAQPPMRMKAAAAGSCRQRNNRQQPCKQTSKALLLLLCIIQAAVSVAGEGGVHANGLRGAPAPLCMHTHTTPQHPACTGSCPAPAGADKAFIDPSTPDTACTKSLCVESYATCCGRGADSCTGSGPAEDLVRGRKAAVQAVVCFLLSVQPQ